MTSHPLSVDRAIKEVISPKYGAVVTFSGCVRDRENSDLIRAIHYDAYGPMVESELAKIVRQAEDSWNVKIYLRHRLGRVPVGEASVIVACGGTHRKEAFEACEFVVDQLKANAPIWKVDYERD